MSKKNKKRSSKNLKINARIIITTVVAIIVPIIIIGSFSSLFLIELPSYFNFSSVNTNTFSTLNQIQWSQTINSINATLEGKTNDNEKIKEINGFVKPLESINSYIYIEKNGKMLYSTSESIDIIEQANKIVPTDKSESINYFGQNGLVIVSHTGNTKDNYTLIVTNEDYTVTDTTSHIGLKQFTNLLAGRTGIIVLIIVLIFIIAITIISFITSKTIVKPIKKIANGADEIANGNLDYNIEYDSTNELGQTVKSFNHMRLRLKESLEKQRKSEEERKILIAGIAHDLRTPLTSAKGYAEGLRDGIANTPEKQKKYINTIISSISNTEKILDDLLTISKLELNTYELNPIDIKARDFFDDGAVEIKEWISKYDFDFEYNCNCGDNVYLSLDIDRCIRVIYNIISNSLKYRREDVKGKVTLSINEYDKSVIIEIADNGIGVDNESIKNIFETMYRADKARTRVSDGSGLGLSVCKQIVELHGGSIWATSTVNEGLSIFISLPKKEAQNEQNSNN